MDSFSQSLQFSRNGSITYPLYLYEFTLPEKKIYPVILVALTAHPNPNLM